MRPPPPRPRPGGLRPGLESGRASLRLGIPLAVLLVLIAGAVQYLRPIPTLVATPVLARSSQVSGSPAALPWPGTGAAAVAVPELGVLGSSGGGRPLPTASMAKLMTALITLERHPLAPGADGPLVTVQQVDVQTYLADLAQGESSVEVSAGEQLSERQLLEALLIPSGNNIATLLGRWLAGTPAAMIAAANARAAQLGLRSTHFADLSGFNPGTVSTPADMIKLAETAMANPTLAAIVALPQVVLPIQGLVYNVDGQLGRDGIVGIKTGSDVQAGGCFVFAARKVVGGRPVTVYGSVMGQPTLAAAFRASRALIDSVAGALRLDHLFSVHQTVARYDAPWGSSSDVLATADLDLFTWPGDVIRTRIEAPAVKAPLAAGSKVGDLVVETRSQTIRVSLVTADPIYAPGRAWRLTRASS